MRTSAAILTAGCVLWAAAACNRDTRGDKVNEASVESSAAPEATAGEPARMSVPMSAHAELTAAEGAAIDGHAKFFQQPDGVLVVLEVQGAPPGKKGVHVHAHGDCSDMKNESMGPHFAPKLEQHGLPSEDSERHLGDLGNITVADDGRGRLEIKVPNATLGADDSTSFLGRALIVHSGEDSGSEAQPAGNSGAPIACGIIHEEGS
jgi:Cu-Zn family superoxide dismutase